MPCFSRTISDRRYNENLHLEIRVLTKRELNLNCPESMSENHSRDHRRSCLRIVLCLLVVWFFVSFGCGILLREWLDANAPSVGNAPFGFWMAQQGSILTFVVLLIIYALLMNRLDEKHGYSEDQ